MDASRRAAYASLAAILLLATLIQAFLFARLPTVSADGIIFVRVARELAQRPIDTMRAEDQHPGYPALLLASTRVVHSLGFEADPESWMVGGVIVSFICGLLSVAVVWFFARDMFDARIASVAAIAYTVLPVPRASAVDAQSDTPHALFYLLAAWMATTGITTGSLRRLAIGGTASGVAYWIRPEGLEVVLLAVPFLVWHALRVDWTWRHRAAAVAALTVPALLVVAPYPLLSGKITSKQIPGAKMQLAQIQRELAAARKSARPPAKPAPAKPAGGKPAATATKRKAPAAKVAPQPAPASPSKPALAKRAEAKPAPTPAPEPASQPAPPSPPVEQRYTASNLLSVLGKAFAAFINSICQGLKFVFIPLYLLGLVALAWRRPPAIQIVYLSVLGVTHIAILMGLHVFSGYIAHRHVIPLVGLAIPFAALGLWQTASVTARLLRLRPAYCIAALTLLCCAVVLPFTLRQLNREFLPVIEATRWIQAHAEPGSGIVCNSPYVGFYGTLPVTELGPQTPTLEAAIAAAPQGARYDYALLHVGAHAYQPEWMGQLRKFYRPVLELPVTNPTGEQAVVMVFEARGRPVRHAARPPQ